MFIFKVLDVIAVAVFTYLLFAGHITFSEGLGWLELSAYWVAGMGIADALFFLLTGKK